MSSARSHLEGLSLGSTVSPGEESRKRHQRIAQQVKAEKEPHLLYIIIS